jgi:MFS family permease
MRSASRKVALPDGPTDDCWLEGGGSWTAASVTENMVTSPVLMTDTYTRESSAPEVLSVAEKRRHLVRAVAASAVGTTIEWYDFFLYGVAAATVFPQKFFPGSDPFYSTLASFSTLFVGFAARPLGAALFGHFGDRVGRKALLIITMMMMGISTVGIGLVPSYEVIGIWGAVLLTIGRVFQGLSVGGEWSGSVLMAGEWADPKRRGFTTSFAQFGAPAGMVLANGARW